MHTLLPAVLPLLETFLESFLWNHVQLGCHVPHNVFSWLKSGPFQWHFQFGEQPKITRSHVGRVGSLTNQGNVVFSQKTLNQMRRMGGCIVVDAATKFMLPTGPVVCAAQHYKGNKVPPRSTLWWRFGLVPIQCLPLPLLPVLGQWYDGPAWPKSALGWLHCHFG